jgi:NAD(P)H-hydrate epimerase
VDGLTGEARGAPTSAQHTVTFAALKPGLLFADGPGLAGRVEVADIGLDTSSARTHLVDDDDVARLVPNRPEDTHKWANACWVVAGSVGMEGAAALAAEAAQRAGAGYVRLSTPGCGEAEAPVEVVRYPVDSVPGPDHADLERFAALVVGPGLGTSEEVAEGVRRLVDGVDRPLVVDGDALTALVGTTIRPGPQAVLTPHDGEFERLAEQSPGSDRIGAVRSLAGRTGSVVLLKGPTTVVAHPDGRVLLAAAGDRRLATAGSGDVLAGILGAFLARGAGALEAAAAAAHVHGRLLDGLPATGVVAGDLSARLVDVLVALGVDGSGRTVA